MKNDFQGVVRTLSVNALHTRLRTAAGLAMTIAMVGLILVAAKNSAAAPEGGSNPVVTKPATDKGPRPNTQIAKLELDLIQAGASQFLGEISTREISLNTVKPAFVKTLPEGITGAKFAVITFGIDAQNKPLKMAVFVTDGDFKIDANRNGNLADDVSPKMKIVQDENGFTRREGVVKLTLSDLPDSKLVDVNIVIPDSKDKARVRSNVLRFTPDYARTGEVKFGEETYRFFLVDGAGDGSFSLKGTSRDRLGNSDVTTLIIDRNENNRNDGLGETFPANAPFNIRGITYELRDSLKAGSSIRFVVSPRKVDEVAPPSDLKVGSQAIAFTGELVSGGTGTLNFPADFKSKVVLLDFWATWCGPCLREMPNMIDAYKKYKDEGFEILGISLDNSSSVVKAYTRNQKITWPMICDGKEWQSPIVQSYRVRGIPAMWLVDGNTGKILAVEDALRGDGKLEAAIEKALVAMRAGAIKDAEQKQGAGSTPTKPAATNPAVTEPASTKPVPADSSDGKPATEPAKRP